MTDDQVLEDINRLAAEEKQIHETAGAREGQGLTDEERERLRAIEIELDRCWDLLRQRRAERMAGRNPDEASPRDAATVETYLQ